MDALARELCDGPNIAHVATLMRDGSPQAAPVWIGVAGDKLMFCKEERSIGHRNLRRDPRLAISIAAVDNPFRCAYIRGQAVEFVEEPRARELLNDLSHKYTGVDYPEPMPDGMVAIFVDVVRAHGDDFSSIHGPAAENR